VFRNQSRLRLAVELAREGRGGCKIGALFVLGDHKEVLARSRALILDPLLYHPESDKQIQTHNMWETVKELAQLDGAFVVSDAGVVVSACRYINASSKGVELALRPGSRHMAAASITRKKPELSPALSRKARLSASLTTANWLQKLSSNCSC
jgi:diadenylate cyclase